MNSPNTGAGGEIEQLYEELAGEYDLDGNPIPLAATPSAFSLFLTVMPFLTGYRRRSL